MSATWRLLAEETPEDGVVSMARDRAIQIAHSRGLVPPTLRLYTWARPTVTLGRFQSASDVDFDVCARGGVDVVRRYTGGRGVLHDDEVTYSVVAGLEDGVPRGVAASYRLLSGMLVEAYGFLGISAELTARQSGLAASAACYLHATNADLSVGSAKLSGSAQVWHEGSVLQHGSIVRSRDAALEAALFCLGDEGSRALDAGTVTLVGLLGGAPTDAEIRDSLARGLRCSLGVDLAPGELSDLEAQLTVEAMSEVRIPEAEEIRSAPHGD